MAYNDGVTLRGVDGRRFVSVPLRLFSCLCAGERFFVESTSYGLAWLAVMRRYSALHPADIPQPVYMSSDHVVVGRVTGPCSRSESVTARSTRHGGRR